MELSDAELVERARSNQMSAYQQLVERYKKKVYYTALGVLSNHHNAEDVLQDTLLQALRSLDRLRQPEGFGPWILRIAYNKSIDYLRKSKREISSDASDDGSSMFDRFENEDPGADPEKHIKSGEIAGVVRQVVNKLPESQRNAFLMKHVAQLSIREIAVATNSTEATVKTNIYRAVQKLRDELAPLVQPRSGFSGAINPGML